ncbi:hypothetical protein CN599_23985 [Bacillus wiedmannii]|nr:hypothetical protein CN599_23985 [Bacillus wiedmannii]
MREVLRCEELAAGTGYIQRQRRLVQNRRTLQALDLEALFASSERANVTQLLPSLKHKIPCYLARDFIIVILPFFPLK